MVKHIKEAITTWSTRNWFELRGVEYSCNLRFFREHQIHITRSGKVVRFSSALESYLFKELIEGEDFHDYDKVIEEIHRNLLLGQYGQGKYVN
jgi:hypothetical protein